MKNLLVSSVILTRIQHVPFVNSSEDSRRHTEKQFRLMLTICYNNEYGVIEPASSPWAYNVVLVRKKDGTFRCCIDYRQLKNVTIKDAYPRLKIDSCLDAMAKAQ